MTTEHENAFEQNQGAQPGKKPYQTPRLIVLGSIEKITAAKGGPAIDGAMSKP